MGGEMPSHHSPKCHGVGPLPAMLRGAVLDGEGVCRHAAARDSPRRHTPNTTHTLHCWTSTSQNRVLP